MTVGLLGAVGEMDRAHPGPNHLNDIIEGLHTAIRLKAGKNHFSFIQREASGRGLVLNIFYHRVG